MKTNVVMKSSDRELFGTLIRQETKTGNLNISDLQVAYDKQAEAEGWSEKRIQDVLAYKSNAERIFYLLVKQGIINSCLNEFIEQVENETLVKVLKRLKVYRTSGARHTKTTWANPYVWMLVAMEMNPRLYGEVVSWMTDGLIINRIEAGNFYKELSSELSRKLNADGNTYKEIARAINYCVFNDHELGIRNTATSNQLKELEDLEKQLTFSLRMGYIQTKDQLIKDLKRHYKSKWVKKS